jgi:uncharacterized RDD family membrane protein YckC
VIVGWLAVLTPVGFGLRAALPASVGAPSLLATDLIAFGVSVLPTGLYLAAGEAGRSQAGWGKRRAGLHVITADGDRPERWRIGIRTVVKLLPWQLAHIAVARLFLQVDAPVTIWTTYTLAVLIAPASLVLAWRDRSHRALHDRVAGTLVVQG